MKLMLYQLVILMNVDRHRMLHPRFAVAVILPGEVFVKCGDAMLVNDVQVSFMGYPLLVEMLEKAQEYVRSDQHSQFIGGFCGINFGG